jgi:hypothetical protein
MPLCHGIMTHAILTHGSRFEDRIEHRNQCSTIAPVTATRAVCNHRDEASERLARHEEIAEDDSEQLGCEAQVPARAVLE